MLFTVAIPKQRVRKLITVLVVGTWLNTLNTLVLGVMSIHCGYVASVYELLLLERWCFPVDSTVYT